MVMTPSQKRALAERAERPAPDPKLAQEIAEEFAGRTYGESKPSEVAPEPAQAAPAATPGRGRPAAAVPRRSVTLSLPEPLVIAIEDEVYRNKRAKTGQKTMSAIVEEHMKAAGYPIE